MSENALPWEGGCRCGQVRLKITAKPLLTMACHCTGCQKMSSSAYSLSAAVPTEGFEVTKGEPVIGGLHGPEAHHYFCPNCMTWMFTRPEGMDWFVNVRPTMLDDLGWFTPFIETWTKTKLPWVNTPAVYRYDEFPPMEDIPRLSAEFTRTLTP